MGGRILVTGGAGFIGSHTVEALLNAGAAVRVIDNLSSGKRENLAHFESPVELIEGDVQDSALLERAMEGCDVVIHLAAQPSVQLSISEPFETHASNYLATLQVLETMRKIGARQLIFASSAAVYPPESNPPTSEESPTGPASPYGVDKLSSEFIINTYAHLYGLKTVCLRFFNIFGERQDPSSPYSGVISIFANRISSGQPLKIYGDGLQSRDFVYVKDLAQILSRLATEPHDAPKIMNVGTGKATSLNDLVQLLGRVTDTDPSVEHLESRAGDIRHSLADSSKLQDLLSPSWTNLETGLSRLIASISPAGKF